MYVKLAMGDEYEMIAKGRGFLYASNNQLYRIVKKHGAVRYLKCCYVETCDGSAKIQNGNFITGVSLL